MKCPFCGVQDTQVKDSRPTDDGGSIRRRRFCPGCGSRFTTFERAETRELTVVKKDGRKRPFDRDKLARSMEVALRKRPCPPESPARAADEVIRRLESRDGEVTTVEIGEEAMRALRRLDKIAYIRYASVYKDFREAGDFKAVVAELEEGTGQAR
jgi:transcriptional repressor NrdR